MELELDELGQVVAVGVREQEEDQGEGVEHQDLVLEQPLQRVPDQLEAWGQLVALSDVGWQSGGGSVQIQLDYDWLMALLALNPKIPNNTTKKSASF